jgi:hypothetical protein
MRKFLLLGLLTITCLTLKAQAVDTSITYTKVIFVDSSLTSADLFARAKAWFATTYRSGKDVIQMEDKENGVLIGKGAFQYTSDIYWGSEGTKGWIYYSITIQVKEGRYKYELTNFIHEGNPFNSGGQLSFGLITSSQECTSVIRGTSRSWRNKVWNDIKTDLNYNAQLIIGSLLVDMNKPVNKKTSDW